MTGHPHRIGVFGGSFDPPHYGHLALAETARVQLRLDRVLFVPAGQPPHKLDQALSAPEVRAELVLAAIGDNPAFSLSRVDLDRPGPHYTVEMLALLQAQFPDVETWFLLMGEDSLCDLPTWFRPEAILEQAVLAVMPRTTKPADVGTLSARLPAIRERLAWLDVPPVDFSATELRRRVRTALPLRYLVPPDVEACICRHKLYV
ncbi:MAG: nicotinate (nicotinamide) nucleotide adenylyltransferase [Anaerolineae bacterium]|nr:nicotinate (nicotinamide) nucleotide adenylyltransferase [Anaerolineae bacterium]